MSPSILRETCLHIFVFLKSVLRMLFIVPKICQMFFNQKSETNKTFDDFVQNIAHPVCLIYIIKQDIIYICHQ